MFTFSADLGAFGGELSGDGGFMILAALLAALLAGVSLLPKAKDYTPFTAILATAAALLVIAQIVTKPSGFSIGWALWAVLAFTVLQAGAAIAALLFESGIITAPAPRPKYEPAYGQYGPPPGGYYGQPQGQPGQHAPQHHAAPQQPGPRPGYPSQYGGGYPQGPSTGGFGALGPQGPGQQHGSPTPPTGFPSFSPPPAVGPGQQPNQAPGQQQPQPSTSPTGPSPS
jgi:hypothetical protein